MTWTLSSPSHHFLHHSHSNPEVCGRAVLTDGSLALLQGPLVHDVAEHGQQEGDGFAAARLSDADEVSA